MKRLILICLLFSINLVVSANNKIDGLIKDLNKEIEKKDLYLKEKFEKINIYKKQLTECKSNDLKERFKLSNHLFNEYKCFIYDSAFYYALQCEKIAYQMNDVPKIALSKLDFGFILISAGMFKEAFDTIKSVEALKVPDTIRIDYYSLKARAYFDLIGYNVNKYYDSAYIPQMNKCIDSAIFLCKKNSLPYSSQLILKNMGNGYWHLAQPILEGEIKNKNIDLHSFAMHSSSLAYIYFNRGMSYDAIRMLVGAIKADIKSSTKETVATHKLAEILYDMGYVSLAHKYIELAMEDASYYKTNLRKKQISNIMPEIEGRQLSLIEKQKKLLFNYSLATTILALLVIISILIIYKHLKELKKAKNTISESNEKLIELNRIKDEYIGYYFNNNSEYIDKLDKLKKAISRKLATRKYEDVEIVINSIDLKKEKENLYLGFDKVFLKLFPDFVNQFNSFFREEDKIIIKDNQLNTNIRIFALLRLGINDTEKIANILDYSVHSIYAYKTKIKNKSLVPNELFEQKIMEIKSL